MLVEPLSNFADHNDVDTTDAARARRSRRLFAGVILNAKEDHKDKQNQEVHVLVKFDQDRGNVKQDKVKLFNEVHRRAR
jgi:hypothetical protein